MTTSASDMAVTAGACDSPDVKPVKSKVRHLAERGMATAEYAVGILAAVALALVLLKVFTGPGFQDMVFGVIKTIFDSIGSVVKGLIGLLPK